MKTRVIQNGSEPVENGVNRAAPVVAVSQTEVAADQQVVWDVLAGIENWPRWNPDVRSVSMQGAVSKGTRFRWRAGAVTITSTLERVEPPRRIAWSGRALGLKALHIYALEGQGGVTLVRTEESYEGLMAVLFRVRLQKVLDRALQSGLRHLKTEAERQTLAERKRS
jgi:uncharacterized membrane protein